MNEFWKHAVKFTGIGGVVFYVLWYLFKDIIAKFTSLTSEQSFILGGLIIVLLALLGSKAIDKSSTNKDKDKETTHNSSVNVTGKNTGNIISGDGNSVNSEEKAKLRTKKEKENRDSSVTVGESTSGNIVTGDGNSVK